MKLCPSDWVHLLPVQDRQNKGAARPNLVTFTHLKGDGLTSSSHIAVVLLVFSLMILCQKSTNVRNKISSSLI